MPRSITIPPEVATTLRGSEVDGRTLKLLPPNLPTNHFQACKKVIQDLGGRWDSRGKLYVFSRPVGPLLDDALGEGGFVKNANAFFRTPPAIIPRLIDLVIDDAPEADQGEWRWLEPSCGDGALVRAIDNSTRTDSAIVGIEIDDYLAEQCEDADDFENDVDIRRGDFLALAASPRFGQFDRVLMNPPFSVQGNPIAYFDHVVEAYSLLRPGGRLVAVTPVGWIAASRPKELIAFRELVEERGFHEVLPPDAFAESGTGVRTCIVVLDK